MTRQEYDSLLEEAGIYDKVYLTEEEADEYDNVRISADKRYYIIDTSDELTTEEIKIALLAKQNLHLIAIKAMLAFFTVLTIVIIVLLLLF